MGAASISRHLTDEFVQNWRRTHPTGHVISRDLTTSDLPVITGEWVGSAYTPEDSRTPAQREVLALSDTLIAELEAADEYVFGVPMHNFTVAAGFRLWIDQIARAGKTFAFVEGAPVGLLKGKKATFLIATGGLYGPGTAMASYNFVEPYLRAVFGFLGVSDTHFHNAGGVSAVNHGQIDRTTFLEPHVEAIRARFQAA
jgi:FMN-dependent NADH-azoreductase